MDDNNMPLADFIVLSVIAALWVAVWVGGFGYMLWLFVSL